MQRCSLLNTVLCIPIFMAACIYTPSVSKKQPYRCNLITRHLELKDHYLNPNPLSHVDYDEDFLLALAAVGPATLIVSGSIVIVGNTIHWIEAKGRCSDEDEDIAIYRQRKKLGLTGSRVY